ncbi:hypothetical protein [Glaciecola sp. 1036]|uniref:hypothetical protein n=1 Tax=Alteromonadaceae TaxID=72275 RepID=UPI003CFF095F
MMTSSTITQLLCSSSLPKKHQLHPLTGRPNKNHQENIGFVLANADIEMPSTSLDDFHTLGDEFHEPNYVLAELICMLSHLSPDCDGDEINHFIAECSAYIHSLTNISTVSGTLLEITRYLLDAIVDGVTLFEEICELALQKSLYWSLKDCCFIYYSLKRDSLGHQYESPLNALYHCNLLPMFVPAALPLIDIKINCVICEDSGQDVVLMHPITCQQCVLLEIAHGVSSHH